MIEHGQFSWERSVLWRLAVALHKLDFFLLLPALARLPLAWGYRLAALRGKFNALTGRDWRSMALGTRHIQRQSLAGYALLPLAASEARRRAWRDQRFKVEARDEFEARLVAGGRVPELACRFEAAPGSAFTGVAPKRERGLLLLAAHFDSFFVGVAFAARGGAKVNLMSSALTHDPRVVPAVQQHFSAKYRGLEPLLNGGKVLDMEQGMRPFYRMLERGETLVVLGDAPVLPNGVSTSVDFLGARRLLAGGALRLAEKTDSDIGGFVCCMEQPGQYVMQWCEPGPASDPQAVQRVYELLGHAILQRPGCWWGSDLLPNMPAVAPLVIADKDIAGHEFAGHKFVIAGHDPQSSGCAALDKCSVIAAPIVIAAPPDQVRGRLLRSGVSAPAIQFWPSTGSRVEPGMTKTESGMTNGASAMTETEENVMEDDAQADEKADYAVLLLSDSPLAGSDELAFGLRALQRLWPGATLQHPQWFVYRNSSAPSPAELLPQVSTRYLLVLLESALLGTATLPFELADALQADGAVCALADEARFADGEWAPTYATQVDFERYVARRNVLPRRLAHGGRAHAGVKAYMLRLDRLQALPAMAQATWAQLPAALGQATVLAPRAFVHSYADYQQGARPEMLELLPAQVKRLLDVGGGEGGFARAFALQRQGQAVLVEPGPLAVQRARASGLQVIEGGIASVSAAEHGLFDAVSLLDVLEHLLDPLTALRQARALLAPGGVLLLSVPNLGYWPVLRDLMAGRFDYQPVGILCNTHLRFFTANSLELLLQEAGFELLQLRRYAPAMDDEFERFLQAAEAAALLCDRDNLATESLHVLARAR